MEVLWKRQDGAGGGEEFKSLQGLHLPETGVYKNSLNLLRIHLIFSPVGGELA